MKDLSFFSETGNNWSLSGGAIENDADSAVLRTIPGTGTLINHIITRPGAHLITRKSFGNLNLSLDFMMARGSNSGIYLQGRYEVQLYDSWKKMQITYIDCGAIYQRWDTTKPAGHEGFEGNAPLNNACLPPGVWQHLEISFSAPVFAPDGKKIRNARFSEVKLNGKIVQKNVEVTGPTRSSLYQDERPDGPIMIQGDHGNLAVRNIKIHQWKE